MTTTPNPQPNIVPRWRPSDYTDPSRPSLVFRLAAGLAIVSWLVGTSWVVLHTSTVGSPDEAANQLFIQHLAQTGQYRLDTSLPAEVLEYLHPRSMAIQGQFLASGSFLGLVQAGAVLEKLFSSVGPKLFTPWLALLGLYAVYLVFRRFWGRWWALLGVVLIAAHPAFFEFATLPYLHNGAFAFGLMIAGWALLRLLEWPTLWRSVVFGAIFGAAVAFRPIEVVWTLPVVVVLLIARRLWKPLFVVLATSFLLQLPWLIANQSVYGSWLSSGYTPSGVFTEEVGTAAVVAPAKTLFTPPGGEWNWHWLSSMWWYYVMFLPAWSIMSAVALAMYFRRKFVTWSKTGKLLLIALLGLYPFVYYGTWNLYPTMKSSVNGALASYVRYWLPLYIIMAPGVVMFLRWLRNRWVVMVLAGVLLMMQAATIWRQPVAGLRARFAADRTHVATRTLVTTNTPADAVIIAGSDDKYLQLDRLATYRLPQNDAQWSAVQLLITIHPTYLLGGVGQYTVASAQSALRAHELDLTPVASINRTELYSVIETQNNP